MVDGQAVFKSWTKEVLAPSLRRMGMKGSGHSFTLPDDECWALLGLQKSTANTSERVVFTFNLSVVNRQLWNDMREWEHYWLSARPSPNIQSPGQISRRIGNLLPDGQDKWWSLSGDASPEDLSDLAREVEAAIRDYGMPELRRLIGANQLAQVQDQLGAIRRIRPRPAHLK